MRLASFATADGRRSFGTLVGDQQIADLGSADVPTLRIALERWGLDGIAQRAGRAERMVRTADIRWLPPITDPDKIVCVGLNYRLHAEEAGMAIPRHPSLFVRFPGSQVGHDEPTVAPKASPHYDYEAEIAVVIGTGGRDIAADEAMAHVAGYSCFAENSIRDYQRHATQATAGKNFEASGAFGPWITTLDEIPDPANVELIGRLNGEELQRDSAANMIFTVPEVIAYVSSFARLLPGDVLVTGTPAGVGFTRKPPLYMKPGDVFEVEIPGVCLLRNPVVAEEEAFR